MRRQQTETVEGAGVDRGEEIWSAVFGERFGHWEGGSQWLESLL